MPPKTGVKLWIDRTAGTTLRAAKPPSMAADRSVIGLEAGDAPALDAAASSFWLPGTATPSLSAGIEAGWPGRRLQSMTRRE